ncbi:MAG: S1 RNA-binding domain-containing protein, partial [Anaerotignum sp.]|nr:S1 RNA-binding domain-containing protein [Anaerotignum sp.]
IAPQDVVEARVIAVGEKVIRVEVFGVECAIPAKEICWDWLGDARERYNVGDRVKVLITDIKTDPEKETVFIKASLKKLIRNDSLERLTRCKVQSTYTGRITDIVNGIIRVDLDIGAKAIAYHCADRRFPGKNDRVTMVVHRLDRSKCVAVGIITKIVRQCI